MHLLDVRHVVDAVDAHRRLRQSQPALLGTAAQQRPQRVARSQPVWYLVPDGVVQYINKYHLYTRHAAPPATTPAAPVPPGRDA